MSFRFSGRVHTGLSLEGVSAIRRRWQLKAETAEGIFRIWTAVILIIFFFIRMIPANYLKFLILQIYEPDRILGPFTNSNAKSRNSPES